MARTIWKFPLEATDTQTIEIPEGGTLLHVAEQKPGEVCLWAFVDPRAPKRWMTIRIFGTGHPMPDHPGRYIGTFIQRSGALVFHVFAGP